MHGQQNIKIYIILPHPRHAWMSQSHNSGQGKQWCHTLVHSVRIDCVLRELHVEAQEKVQQ
jgi:hypothetical protein